MIIIDTTVAVNFLRGEARAVSTLKSALKLTDSVGISTVSLFELLHPIHHRKLEKQERTIRAFVHQMRLLPLDAEAAGEAARILGVLMRIGRPVNTIDAMIAGTAVANGAEKLISSDRDFETISKVSNLRVEVVL